jgi:hypothetical protein
MRSELNEERKRLIHQIRNQAVTAWRSRSPEAHEAALQQIAYKVSKLKEEETTDLPPELGLLYKSIYKLIDQQNSGSKKTPSEIRFVTSKRKFTEDLLAFFTEKKVDQVPAPLIPEPEINQVPKTIIAQILPHIHSFNSTITDQKYHIKEAEIARQIQELENPSIDATTPMYFSKRKTDLAHSFLISKNEDNTYSILIKPNVKNKDYLRSKEEIPSEIMQNGTYKMVKKAGILINISADKKTVVSVERQVIVSCGGESKDNKNKRLSSKMGATLTTDGFKELNFQDDQNKRTIYTMPYLGESISQGWSHVRYVFQKRKLALALIDDVLDNEKMTSSPIIC